MPVDISKLLTATQKARLANDRREIARLFGLPDRWLAEELLRMARDLRERFPDKLKDPYGATYEPNLVWHVIPEVAKRLGANSLRPNEAQRYSDVSDEKLRVLVGVYLNNTSLDRFDRSKSETPSSGCILGHCVANGNPIAFAVDRFAPAPEPGGDRNDWLARRCREVAKARDLEPSPYWTPAMQDYPRARKRAEQTEAENTPTSVSDVPEENTEPTNVIRM